MILDPALSLSLLFFAVPVFSYKLCELFYTLHHLFPICKCSCVSGYVQLVSCMVAHTNACYVLPTYVVHTPISIISPHSHHFCIQGRSVILSLTLSSLFWFGLLHSTAKPRNLICSFSCSLFPAHIAQCSLEGWWLSHSIFLCTICCNLFEPSSVVFRKKIAPLPFENAPNGENI